ncbi:MAG TPA: NACHT domain-containing protein [Pirellulales bacterium]|jgi:hypothetical protein
MPVAITTAEMDVLIEYCRQCVSRFGDIYLFGIADAENGRTVLPRSGRIARSLISHYAEQVAAVSERPLGFDPAAGTEHEEQVRESLRSGLSARRIFVTGEGGTGKTEFARRLALGAADEFLNSPDRTQGLIPIYCSLAALGRTGDILAEAFHDLLIARPSLRRKLLHGGHLLLVLDGLDEVAPQIRPAIDHQLDRLLNGESCRRCSLALLGRETSLGNVLGPSFPAANRYRLMPISHDDVEFYITTYFRHIGNVDRGKKLLSEIVESQPLLQELLQNPFCLSGLCWLWEHQKIALPAEPSEVVRQLTMDLLARRNIDPQRGLRILSRLAAFACERGFRFETTDAGFPTGVPADLLDELARHSGLMFRHGLGGRRVTYSFANRLIAEFLAGEGIARNGAFGTAPPRGSTVERSIIEFFSRHVWHLDEDTMLVSLSSSLCRDRPKLAVGIATWVDRHVSGYAGSEAFAPFDDLFGTLQQRFRIFSQQLPTCNGDGKAPEVSQIPTVKKFDSSGVIEASRWAWSSLLRSRVLPWESHLEVLRNEFTLSGLAPRTLVLLANLVADVTGNKEFLTDGGEDRIWKKEDELKEAVHGNRAIRDRVTRNLGLIEKMGEEEYVKLLVAIAPGDPVARNVLIDRLRGEDTPCYLLRSLAAIAPRDRVARDALLAMLRPLSGLSYTSVLIAEALRFIAPGDAKAAREIAGILGAPFPQFQRNMDAFLIPALIDIAARDEEVRDVIISRMHVDRYAWTELQVSYIHALAISAPNDVRALAEITQFLERRTQKEEIFAAVDALMVAGRNEDVAIRALIAKYRDASPRKLDITQFRAAEEGEGIFEIPGNGNSLSVKRYILQSLPHIASQNGEVKQFLRSVVIEEKERGIRATAARALAAWASSDKEVKCVLLDEVHAAGSRKWGLDDMEVLEALGAGCPGDADVAWCLVHSGMTSELRRGRWRDYAVIIGQRDHLMKRAEVLGWPLGTDGFQLSDMNLRVHPEWKETVDGPRGVLVVRRAQIHSGLDPRLLPYDIENTSSSHTPATSTADSHIPGGEYAPPVGRSELPNRGGMTVHLVLFVSERRVLIDGREVEKRLTPNGTIMLKKLMSAPRKIWSYSELLDPPPSGKIKGGVKALLKEHSELVRSTYRLLPQRLKKLIVRGRGGYHQGTTLHQDVDPQIIEGGRAPDAPV